MKRFCMFVAVAAILVSGCAGIQRPGKPEVDQLRVIVDDTFGDSTATVESALQYWEQVSGVRFFADTRDVRSDFATWIGDDVIGVYYIWDPDSWQRLVWNAVVGDDENADRILGFTLRSTRDVFLRPSASLFAVTVHEVGHALGCPHVDDETDIMYPYIRHGAFTVSAECIETVRQQHAIMLSRQNRKAAKAK